MGEITFEQLPLLMGEMSARLKRIEEMLKEGNLKIAVEESFMTVTEAANLLKLSESTIYGKVCRGEIPFNKRGKRLYFEKEKLVKWVLEGKHSGLEDRIEKAEQFFRSAPARRRTR